MEKIVNGFITGCVINLRRYDERSRVSFLVQLTGRLFILIIKVNISYFLIIFLFLQVVFLLGIKWQLVD